ncbi:MAG TPA: lysine 2,3-aminomutase, partial [Clostridia bacterium]|nr:lysine 2,3-aminomutase [Clostridia bacterium]
MSNRITSVDKLVNYTGLMLEEPETAQKAASVFPMTVTPYYASLIEKNNPQCPIRLQCVPNPLELVESSCDMDDPLNEDADSPVKGLTHRYPDRVLFLVTNECSMYCRHCTRKRKIGDREKTIDNRQIERGLAYIRAHPEIRDVLISGGDPFILSDSKLENIVRRIKIIPHVEVIRIGTRTPVVLPQRITGSLVNMLKKYQPLWINTHFNHPREFTPESTKALRKLVDAGIPIGNQSVLLKGVNDCSVIMRKLVHLLVQNRVRPYYLYQCDLSRGIDHFRTSIGKGIEIMESLIGHTSGFAIPRYVVDAPGGGGKIPLLPNYLLSMTGKKTVLRNYEGVICVYEEPSDTEFKCPEGCHYCKTERNQKRSPVGLEKLVGPYCNTISMA